MVVEKAYSLCAGGKNLPLPCFFPSISSIKTNLRTADYLQLLKAVQHPLFLISAYDIYNEIPGNQTIIKDLLTCLTGDGTVIFLDSGNYESYWKQDSNWTSEHFIQIVKCYPFHLAFCFDNQNPPSNASDLTREVIKTVVDNQQHTNSGTIIPIIHGLRELLPIAAKQVAKELVPILLAIPERVLGDGVIQRAETVRKIRLSLDELGYYCPIHLLGTGNPLSILIYTLAGADSYDGLEWCQTVVDHKDGRLYHFQQWDFFRNQTAIGINEEIPFTHSVLSHNLVFYRKWLQMINQALRDGSIKALVQEFLPKQFIEALRKILPEI